MNKGKMEKQIKLRVIKAEFPGRGRGALFYDDNDGEYLVMINSKLSEDEQAASFLHECLHLWHDDFNSNVPVRKIEETRAGEVKRLIELMNK